MISGFPISSRASCVWPAVSAAEMSGPTSAGMSQLRLAGWDIDDNDVARGIGWFNFQTMMCDIFHRAKGRDQTTFPK